MKDKKIKCICLLDEHQPVAHCPIHGELDIDTFGQYVGGLTDIETKQYLRRRARGTKFKRRSTKRLFKQFIKVMGVGNTSTSAQCGQCGEMIGLIFREDVWRFANVMFKGIPTYFD